MEKNLLYKIAQKRLSKDEFDYIQNIDVKNENMSIYKQVELFELSLNKGVGIHNINDFVEGRGRYNIKDRDIFRPFQYIEAYLQMDYEDIEWITREIVHMCGLHLESAIKRLFKLTRIPLGQALTYKIAELKLGRELLSDLKVIVKPYNSAKHSLMHDKDTHMFDIHTTLLCYAITRKLSNELLPLIHLYTDENVWKEGVRK